MNNTHLVYNHHQLILLLTLPYTTLFLIMSSYCCDRYRLFKLVLCARLSTSALAPLSPSGLSHSHSVLSVELSLRASASWHAPSSPILQSNRYNSVRLCVLLRSSAVEGTMYTLSQSPGIMTSVSHWNSVATPRQSGHIDHKLALCESLWWERTWVQG